MNDKVVPHRRPPGRQTATGNGGNGNIQEIDARLRAVETGLAELHNEVKHLASKEDIQKIKTWILGSIIGAVPILVGLFFIIVKLLQIMLTTAS